MKIFSAVCLLLLSQTIRAQQEARAFADSLISALPTAENDTVKIRLYNKIFYELSFIDAKESMQYARKGLAQAQTMQWPKGIAVFYTNLGTAFSNEGQYDSAQHYYEAALKVHIKNSDKYNTANTYNSMGTAAQNIRGDFSTAAQYYFKALQIAEEIKDSTLLPLTLSNISRIYSLQKNYQRAKEFATRALQIRETTGTPDAIAQSLEDIAKILYNAGNNKEAEELFLKARAIYEQSGNLQGLATIWSGLSLVYNKDFRKMIEARLKSKSLWDEVNPLHPEAITNTGNLGVAYLDLVRYDSNKTVRYGDVIPNNKQALLKKAEAYLKTSIDLALQTGDADNRSFFTGALAELQELTGDYKNAFYNFRIFKEMEDSIYSQQNKNKIAEAQSQRAIDQKNNEIRINQLALSNQRKTMWGLAAGLVLLGIIGTLLYRQNKIRKATNAKLLLLNKELNHANQLKAKFFGILSHDLRAPVANLINFLHLRNNHPELLDKEKEMLHEKKITASAEALLENMENILLWSKNQMDQLKPDLTLVSTQSLFTYIQQQFAHAETVYLNFEGDANLELYTDENCIRSIMYNLTSNAIKAVATVPVPQIGWNVRKRGHQTILSIHDNGSGMDPELLLNDELRTAAASSVRSGLGLTIVKDLAKAIGCTLTVIELENGTCIEIAFPSKTHNA